VKNLQDNKRKSTEPNNSSHKYHSASSSDEEITFSAYKFNSNNNSRGSNNDDIELIEIEEEEEDGADTLSPKKLKVENQASKNLIIKSEKKSITEQVFNHEEPRGDWKKDLEIQSLKERLKAAEEKLEKKRQKKEKYKNTNSALKQKIEEKNNEIIALTVECTKLETQRDMYMTQIRSKEPLLLGN